MTPAEVIDKIDWKAVALAAGAAAAVLVAVALADAVIRGRAEPEEEG